VFANLRALGGTPPRTIVIGCQVADLGDRIGLSDPVRAAIPAAVRAVGSTVAMLGEKPCA
jgi:hydrogenase maturation protease